MGETATDTEPTCLYCGRAIERLPRGGTRKRYCGNACRKNAWLDRKTVELNKLIRQLAGRL